MKNIFKKFFKKTANSDEPHVNINERTFIKDLQTNYQHFNNINKNFGLHFTLTFALLPIILILFNHTFSIFYLIAFSFFWGLKYKKTLKHPALKTILDYLNNPSHQAHIIETIKNNHYGLQPNEFNFFVNLFTEYFQKNQKINIKNVPLFFDYLKEYQSLRRYDNQNEYQEIESFSEQYDKLFNQKEKNS